MSRPPSVTDIAFEVAAELQQDAAIDETPEAVLASIPRLAAMSDAKVKALMFRVKRDHKSFNTRDFMAQIQAERERNGGDTVYSGDWHDQLDRQGEFGFRPVLRNAILAITHAPEWQGVLSWDEFRQVVCTRKPTPWSAGRIETWSQTDTTKFTDWIQGHRIYLGKEAVYDAIEERAKENPSHSVRDYLSELKWDGTPRLDWWLRDYLGVQAEDAKQGALHAIQGARWMQAAVARVMEPGCKADNCLILEGPQGKFKSTALDALGSPWFIDHMPDLHSKDAIMQLHGAWILEISEMSAFKRAETEVIKQFLTRRSDKFRSPYERLVKEVKRQCVFAASVNPGANGIFTDETGNRRFWPVACGKIDIDKLSADRDQLWAEAFLRYKAFRAGETGSHPWWLDDAELVEEAEKEQAERYQSDPWETSILDFLELKRAENEGRGCIDPVEVSVHECLVSQKCLQIAPERCTPLSQRRVAAVLMANKWRKHRVGPRGARVYVYREPLK